MKKKILLLITTSLVTSLSVGAMIFISNTNNSFNTLASEKPSSLDCSYYFNEENGYTSIHDINEALYNGESVSSDTKTWGTVTCAFQNGNSTVQQYYIQSTDKYGNSAALSLYKVDVTEEINVGNVVTISNGSYKLYNGLPEVEAPTYTIDYQSNPNDVEVLETDSSYWNKSSLEEKKEIGKLGPIKVSVNNVELTAIGDYQTTGIFNDNLTYLNYYRSLSNTNDIYSTFHDLENKHVDVIGYSTLFANSNNFTNSSKLEMFIRDPNDISEHSVELSYISVENPIVAYFEGDNFETPKVVAYYDNGSSSVVTSQSSFSGYDMYLAGNQVVTVTYMGLTTSYNIVVEEIVLDHIEVYPTATSFYVGDSFDFDGSVKAIYNNGTIEDVTALVSYSGYNMSIAGNQLVTATYEDKTDSYYIEVIDVKLDSIIVSNANTVFDIGDEFEFSGSVTANLNNKDSFDVTNECSFSGFDSSTSGYQEITVSYTYLGVTKYDYYDVYITPVTMNTMTIDSIYISSSYSTGNYGVDGDFEYYRAINKSVYNSFVKLLPFTNTEYVESLPGALYNINPISDIKSIELTYYTSDSGDKPYISFGENNYDDGTIEFNFSSSLTTQTFDLSSYDVNYFKICSGDSTLFLNKIEITYSGNTTPHGNSFIIKKDTCYRINPTIYEGTLVPGETSVTVPIDISFDENTKKYAVLEEKTYTYYTYDYVSNHTECINDAAMITPVDVSNYYTIFGEWPANYALKKTYVSDVFGNMSRQVSEYTKTDGYSTAVPYRNQPGGYKPLYYEFDIAVNDSYYSSTRGVARVIGWKYGFTCYDTYPVCIYTDDHYATFLEFNNYGGFATRFNAERNISGHTIPNMVTLIK